MHMLEELGSTRPLIVLVSEDLLTIGALLELQRMSNVHVCAMDRVKYKVCGGAGLCVDDSTVSKAKSDVMHKYRRSEHFSKLNLFSLDLDVAIYLDADVLPMRNMDHLFDRIPPHIRLQAVCDCASLAHMNSGVMVVRPREFDFGDMLSSIKLMKSYNDGDQGFLNTYALGSGSCLDNTTAGFASLEPTYGWQRSYACEQSNTPLQSWLGSGTYTGTSLRDREGEAIAAHQSDFHAIHYVWPEKLWDACGKGGDSCDIGKGRGRAMDTWYFEAMKRFGLIGAASKKLGIGIIPPGSPLYLASVEEVCGQ